jgi:hypothetical protein
MKFTSTLLYRHRRDCWQLELTRDKEMQNARVKALIVTNCCDLSSLAKLDTVERACAVV